MQTKTYKILSVVMAMAILLSSFCFVIADEPNAVDIDGAAVIDQTIPADDTVIGEGVSQPIATTDLVGASEILPYNYKKGWDSSEEFVNSIPYRPHTSEGPKEPKINFVPGKYGNCLSISMYSFYVPGATYGATVPMVLPTTTAVLLKPKTEYGAKVESLIGQAMYGFKKLGFWVKVDWPTEIVGPSNRKFSMSFGTSGGSYGTSVTFMASDEWQYIVKSASEFTNGSKNLENTPADILSLTSFTIVSNMHEATSIAGYAPVEGQAETKSVLYLDEFTFDKTTDTLRPYTRPSNGELEYCANNELSDVTIDGTSVSGIAGSDGSTPVEIELPFNFDVNKSSDKARIVPIVKCPDIPINNTLGLQMQMGARATVDLPTSLPGQGSIVVEAGNGEKRTYTTNFILGPKFKVVDTSPTAPFKTTFNKNFKVTNNSGEAKSIVALAVVKHKTTGALADVTFRSLANVQPNVETSFNAINLTVPSDIQNYYAEYMFFEDLVSLKRICNSIYFNK